MLTAKQEKFVQCVVLEEMTYSDAYRAAYNTERMADKTVNEKACLLAGDDKIRARMTELREELLTPKVMTAQKRQEWLTQVIQDPDIDINAKLKASDQLNKMQGEYVTKVEGTMNIAKLEDLI